MHKLLLTPIALTVGTTLAVSGCHHKAPEASAPAGAPAAASAFDLDDQYKPCNDFANYVNAKWNKANPIPADEPAWGAHDMLAEKTLEQQKDILEAAAGNAKQHSGSALEQKLGDLYAAGMDTDAIDKAGFDPIKPQLAAIDAVKTPADIVEFIDTGFNNGDRYVFDFSAGDDLTDATRQIGYVYQGGLGLPDRDYYLSPDKQPIRDGYTAYIAKSLELIGTPPADAKAQADQAMAFETALAEGSLSLAELGELDNQYHFVTVADADKISPHFSWAKFFAAQGVQVDNGFSLSQPKFITAFDHLLETAPIPQWQAYLKFQVVNGASPAFGQAFQDNRFDFYGKTLNGLSKPRDRWKSVVDRVNDAMGMGLGELYVGKYLPPDAKARADEMAGKIRDALKQHIENITWMSEDTKKKALDKWGLLQIKAGYPDANHWRDWNGLAIQQGNWYANLKAAGKYNYHYEIGKIGKATDRGDWSITPQTVDLAYLVSTNSVTVPAAVLQPPFFFPDGDDALNFGGIGWLIGHESSHAFDDQGSQFDGNGNRVNWWAPEDKKQYDDRTVALVKQYDGYAPIPNKPDLHVNGQLTLTENVADLVGLNIAYDALQAAVNANPAESDAKFDGMTADQRFFLSSARIWEGTTTEQTAELLLNTDPNSPEQIRAFASASNMPQFAQAFSCQPGDPMAHTGDQLVTIW